MKKEMNLVGIREAARLLGFKSHTTVLFHLKQGNLPFIEKREKTKWIKTEDLATFKKSKHFRK